MRGKAPVGWAGRARPRLEGVTEISETCFLLPLACCHLYSRDLHEVESVPQIFAYHLCHVTQPHE